MSDIKNITEYLKFLQNNFPAQKSIESLVLEHGKLFTANPRPRPKGIRKGANRMCFMNAYRLTYQGEYEYVEGFAISNIGIQLPVHHAWVIDADDMVVETTWKESGLAYYGIVLDIRFIDAVLFETRTYGVLDYTSATFRRRFGLV